MFTPSPNPQPKGHFATNPTTKVVTWVPDGTNPPAYVPGTPYVPATPRIPSPYNPTTGIHTPPYISTVPATMPADPPAHRFTAMEQDLTLMKAQVAAMKTQLDGVWRALGGNVRVTS
jgi:hypothetical protein